MSPSAATIVLIVLTTCVVADSAVTTATGSSAVKGFVETCIAAAVPGFSYNPAGSGAGAAAAAAGDVGISDVAIGVGGDSVECPFVSGSIGVVVNGVAGVKLTPCTLAGIYQGTIVSWDDAAIQADNPGAGFSGPIVPIGRSDSSGSTNLFTQYLSQCPSYTLGVGKVVPWVAGTLTAMGTSGVRGLVSSTPGGVTYVSSGSPQALLEGNGGFFDSTSSSAPIQFTAVVAAKKSVAGLKEFLETVYSDGVVGCTAGANFIPLTSGQIAEGAGCIGAL